jgi:hypothetical protein
MSHVNLGYDHFITTEELAIFDDGNAQLQGTGVIGPSRQTVT